MLLSLGFTEYESRVYFALIGKKHCSAAEAGRISGVPRNKVYDVLKSLEGKGGCILLLGAKKLYEPTSPTILAEKAQAKIREETARLKKSIEYARSDLFSLYDDPILEDEEIDYITVLSDPLSHAEKIIEMNGSVSNEIVVFSKKRSIARGLNKIDSKLYPEVESRASANLQKAVNERGVKYRVITRLDNLNFAIARDMADRYRDNDNVDYRLVDSVPCKATICDCSEILLALRNRKNTGYSEVSFYMRDSGLAEVLHDSFYSYFNKGISVKDIDIDMLESKGEIVKN